MKEYVELARTWREKPEEAWKYLAWLRWDFDRIVAKLIGRHVFGPDPEEVRLAEEERSGCEIPVDLFKAATHGLYEFPEPLPEDEYRSLWSAECFPGEKKSNLANRLWSAQLALRTLTDAGVGLPFDSLVVDAAIEVVTDCECQRQWKHGKLNGLWGNFISEVGRLESWVELTTGKSVRSGSDKNTGRGLSDGKKNDPRRARANKQLFWSAMEQTYFDEHGKLKRQTLATNAELKAGVLKDKNPSNLFRTHFGKMLESAGVSVAQMNPKDMHQAFFERLKASPDAMLKVIKSLQTDDHSHYREKQSGDDTLDIGSQSGGHWNGQRIIK